MVTWLVMVMPSLAADATMPGTSDWSADWFPMARATLFQPFWCAYTVMASACSVSDGDMRKN